MQVTLWARMLLQCRQSLTIFLMNDFPRGIQNCRRTRARVCSPPTWKCFLWRSWTSNLDKGCFGERTTWCLVSKGIGALSRWPPTLTIPSVRTGCKGRSGLLLDSAQLAWRSLYSCLNNSIWAILHKANKASSRSSTSDQLSPESHHYCG